MAGNVDSTPKCNRQWPAGHCLLHFSAGNGRGKVAARCDTKTKRGNEVPQGSINFVLHV